MDINVNIEVRSEVGAGVGARWLVLIDANDDV